MVVTARPPLALSYVNGQEAVPPTSLVAISLTLRWPIPTRSFIWDQEVISSKITKSLILAVWFEDEKIVGMILHQAVDHHCFSVILKFRSNLNVNTKTRP